MIVPDDILRVSMDFEYLHVIHHNERYIVVSFLIIYICNVVMDSSVSEVPWHISILGAVKF